MHGEATREGAARMVLGWGKLCTAPALEALGEHKLWSLYPHLGTTGRTTHRCSHSCHFSQQANKKRTRKTSSPTSLTHSCSSHPDCTCHTIPHMSPEDSGQMSLLVKSQKEDIWTYRTNLEIQSQNFAKIIYMSQIYIYVKQIEQGVYVYTLCIYNI